MHIHKTQRREGGREGEGVAAAGGVSVRAGRAWAGRMTERRATKDLQPQRLTGPDGNAVASRFLSLGLPLKTEDGGGREGRER